MFESFLQYMLLSASVLNFFFCFLILQHKPKKQFHYFLAGIAFFSGIYAFIMFFQYFVSSQFLANFLAKLSFIGYFIPFFFILFVLSLKQVSNLKLKAIFYFLPLPILLYFAIFTDLIIKETDYSTFPPKTIFGPFDFLGRGYLIILLIIGIFNLLRIYKKSQGEEKIQLKYFLCGIFIYSIMGLITTGIIPLMIYDSGNSLFTTTIIDFGIIGALFWVGISSYAIIRKELFGIKAVLTHFLVGTFSVLLVWQIFSSKSLSEYLWNIILLLVFLFFGYLSIKSIQREIRQKRELEQINKGIKIYAGALLKEKNLLKNEIREKVERLNEKVDELEGIIGI